MTVTAEFSGLIAWLQSLVVPKSEKFRINWSVNWAISFIRSVLAIRFSITFPFFRYTASIVAMDPSNRIAPP